MGEVLRLGFVLVLVFGCLGVGVVALGAVGSTDRVRVELAEAEAAIAKAEAEGLENRVELAEAEAERVRAEAEAEALKSRSEELVKHSRLNRRLLTWAVISKDLMVVLWILLSGANLATWGAGLWLLKREREGGE
jgi:multidrug resistance efflux pump